MVTGTVEFIQLGEDIGKICKVCNPACVLKNNRKRVQVLFQKSRRLGAKFEKPPQGFAARQPANFRVKQQLIVLCPAVLTKTLEQSGIHRPDSLRKNEFQALQSFKSAACWLKPLRPTITNPDVSLQCPLWVCPELEDYQTDCGPLQLGLAGQHQRSNTSLALQLSHTWLQRRRLQDQNFPSTTLEGPGVPLATPFTPSPIMTKGLADTVWAGRTQTLKNGEVTYFLDGAHTRRSMQACVSWFQEAAVRCERNPR
ncbi:folylpolyglutamate synthase, mitochondrial-like [Gadus chalcogrammus]|uniref:folylpolyglutamate synthase, mitochondrial-like n=1 Tax=Gadus chalcogrammus TaxID=1042646 RepID=UPI0024C38568|nr:folylpolyglutamate synthase, mitochondrial-like [Gadus chalcogrammus]